MGRIKNPIIRIMSVMGLVVLSVAMVLGVYAYVNKDTLFGDKEEMPSGSFYSLESAYERGLITKNDLLNISYNYSHTFNQYEEGFNPKKYSLDDLDSTIAKEIKETRAYVMREYGEQCSAEDIYIKGYYGTYNGCVVVRLSDRMSVYPGIMIENNIGGVKLVYSPPVLLVWIRNS